MKVYAYYSQVSQHDWFGTWKGGQGAKLGSEHAFFGVFKRGAELVQRYGLDGILIACPFGSDSKHPYDLDAPVKIDDMIRDGRVPSWTGRTAEDYATALGHYLEEKPDQEVFTYLGSWKTPQLKQWRRFHYCWLTRVLNSVRAILLAHDWFGIPYSQLPIGLDQGRSIEPDSQEIAFFDMLQALGIQVHIEPHPRDTGSEHLLHYGACPGFGAWQGHGNSHQIKSQLKNVVVQMTGNHTKEEYEEVWQDEHVDAIAWKTYELDFLLEIRGQQ